MTDPGVKPVREWLRQPFSLRILTLILGTTAKFEPSVAAEEWTQILASKKFPLRANGEIGISYYTEAIDQSGMWRTSNHWGQMGTTNWTFGTPDEMKALGGREVESGFWFLDKPRTGFVKYTDMTPLP